MKSQKKSSLRGRARSARQSPNQGQLLNTKKYMKRSHLLGAGPNSDLGHQPEILNVRLASKL